MSVIQDSFVLIDLLSSL